MFVEIHPFDSRVDLCDVGQDVLDGGQVRGRGRRVGAGRVQNVLVSDDNLRVSSR